MELKYIFHRFTAMGLIAFILTACQTNTKPVEVPPVNRESTLNNAYSLLYQLLEQEKNVSFLRFLKHENYDVKEVVKKIATASGRGGKMLEKFHKADPSVSLDDLRLPSGEVLTRAAIAKTEQKQLLGESGDEFQLRLLLTQIEALQYGWHLCIVISKNDSNADRIQGVLALEKQMQDLHHEVFVLMLAKIKLATTGI